MNGDSLMELALMALQAKQCELARRYLGQALAKAPDNLEAGFALVNLELQEGMLGAAVEVLAELWRATRNPEVGDLMAEAGLALLDQGRKLQRSDDRVMERLAGMLRALHGSTGVLVDTLQSHIVGGLAIDAIKLVPVFQAGLTARADKPVVFFSGESANPALMEMIGRELPFFSDPEFPRLAHYTSYDWGKGRYTLHPHYLEEFFGRHAPLFRDLVQFTHSTNGSDYLESLEEETRLIKDPPKIDFTPAEKERGERFLRETLGVRPGGWFVCVYARDGAYYKETPDSPNWFRNSDITTFVPAIDAILAAGGHVVRLGEKADRVLEHTDPRFFDYTCSGLREPLLDIFLLARCRFLLGTPSGLCHVAYIFRTPELMVNAVNVCNIASTDLYIPKKIHDTATGVPLPFETFLERFHGGNDTGHFFENGINQQRELKVRYQDNSADEIASATVEMLARLEGTHREDEHAAQLRQAFRQSWLRWNPAMAETAIATSFLKAHPALF